MEEGTPGQGRRSTEPIVMSYPQKHKLELETHQIFSLLSPCQKKKKVSENNYVDEYGVCYLKRTGQSIPHNLKREGVIKGIQDRVWDLIQFHPELRLWTALLPASVPGSS